MDDVPVKKSGFPKIHGLSQEKCCLWAMSFDKCLSTLGHAFQDHYVHPSAPSSSKTFIFHNQNACVLIIFSPSSHALQAKKTCLFLPWFFSRQHLLFFSIGSHSFQNFPMIFPMFFPNKPCIFPWKNGGPFPSLATRLDGPALQLAAPELGRWAESTFRPSD